jgi:hypothetical protein
MDCPAKNVLTPKRGEEDSAVPVACLEFIVHVLEQDRVE